jgi:hypothetical protein
MNDEQQTLILKVQKSLEAAKLLLHNEYPDYATDQATEQIDRAEQFLTIATQYIGTL